MMPLGKEWGEDTESSASIKDIITLVKVLVVTCRSCMAPV